LTRIAKKLIIYICSVCHKEKQKKRLPRVPRQGHSGEVFFLKKRGKYSSRVLGMGHSGKRINKKNQISSPSVALNTRGRGFL
jgi:hypothetical protein